MLSRVALLLTLALALTACSAGQPSAEAPAVPLGAPQQSPQRAQPAQPAAALPRAAPAVTSPPASLAPAQVPPRIRANGYTPGEPAVLFFDADG